MTGQIEGNPILAGSRVGGRVSEVLVRTGDPVKKGDVLVRLEGDEAEALADAAKARADQAKAVYDKLLAGPRPETISQAKARVMQAEQKYTMALEGARSEDISTAGANLATAEAQLGDAQSEFDRAKNLYPKVISKQRYDQAEHNLEAAEGRRKAAASQLDLLVKGTRDEDIAIANANLKLAEAMHEELVNGSREEDIRAARAGWEMAQADHTRARVMLDEMTVTAPMDGIAESVDIHVGDLVGPGPIVEIVDPDDLEVTVYVSAALLGGLSLGQSITLTSDSHGDQVFSAEIIQVATSGEFTPRNLQTQEDRVQQVFGIRLRLDSHGGALRPGMTVTARIGGNDESPPGA